MKAELVTMQEAAALTGYALQTLRIIRMKGSFIEPARMVGQITFYEPRAVMAWKRRYVKTRDGRGVPPPPDPKPARKRKTVRNGH